MFEMIGELFAIGFWAAAILMFFLGFFLCVGNIINGNGLEKAMGGIAIFLGILTFFYMYDWSESIAWCLLTTGLVLGFVGGLFSKTGERVKPEPKEPDFIDTYLKVYGEYTVTKQAMKDAINETRK